MSECPRSAPKKGHFMFDSLFPFYALAFVLSAATTALCERRFIPVLSKKAQQPIYTEGPSWHIKKSGTPTMGGLAFLPAAAVIWVLFSAVMFRETDREYVLSFSLTLGYAFLNALLGIFDDATKLRHKQNEGLTPTEKLIFQFLFSGLFLAGRAVLLGDGTELVFSFGTVHLGLFYYPLVLILLVGIVNFANLTDGIDGLASSVAFGIGVSMLYISAFLNPAVSVTATLMTGIAVGFLLFNLHPAKIFMGDTGSLFFGALTAGAAVSLGNPVFSVSFGGVYVIEGLSVVLQVLFYKLTKRRLFLMAPLHHHFEKRGWSENKICLVALLVTLALSVPVYFLYLPR